MEEHNSILFLLTPKSKVVCILKDFTLRQVVEKMDFHHYAAMPILTDDGHYFGVITEGDLLWYIRGKHDLNYSEAEHTPLSDIPLNRQYKPVTIGVPVDELIEVATAQNFVPIVDDNGTFIGIVTRRSIIQSVVSKQQK